MWKPGQIVTIRSKKYRITKYHEYSCDYCDHSDTPDSHQPCRTCLYDRRMPYDCYPKEIKPKSVMG